MSRGTSVYAGAVKSGDYGERIHGIPVTIGGQQQFTSEVLQDDGTYGKSIEYIYWFDAQGRYHQQYPSAATVIHVSNEPIKTKKPVVTLEIENGK